MTVAVNGGIATARLAHGQGINFDFHQGTNDRRERGRVSASDLNDADQDETGMEERLERLWLLRRVSGACQMRRTTPASIR